MKIGVVSDTHMPRYGKQLPDIVRQGLLGTDLILHAGDWQTLDVYEQFREIAPVEGVAGNVDGEEIVRTFGYKKLLELEGFRIGLVHGHRGRGNTTPERARKAFSGDEVDIIVFGHSHIPFHEKVGGVPLFNPGSPTDKRRQPRFSYGILTLRRKIMAEHVYYADKNL
ncbi:MAG TPA: metallophosphoesterase [Bacillales bacterium]|nr:metallophosphoesterase [Bacillales bacterium]